jgi:gamma-glutamylcyclotransferase (GGCT)/AIG2-like uncharacterized protein YtfP
MFYFAYGSNLWRQQMISRCPEHRVIGVGSIPGWRWIITTRGYASIVKSESDHVFGTVYDLSAVDLQNLDRFEGVTQGNYYKELITVFLEGLDLSCMVYIDPITEEGQPKLEYITRINNGILDAGLPNDYVIHYLRPYVPQLLNA